MAEDDPQRESVENRRERTEHVESILRQTESLVQEDRKYPVRSEELAAAYADQEIDLPNETETLGDVFDRLSERYDSPAEAREAVLNELTGAEGDEREFNDERALEELAEDTSVVGALEEEDVE